MLRWGLALGLLAACGGAAAPPADPSVVSTLDLGPVSIPPSGLSDGVAFDVPAGALGLVIHARGPGGAGKLSLDVTQDGAVRCSYLAPLASESPMLPALGEVAIALPNGTAGLGRELGGHYVVRVFHDGGALTPVMLSATFKTAPGKLAEQRLPLTLVLVGDVARGPVDDALDVAQGIWARAGVELDVAPEVVTVSGAEAAPFASIDVTDGPDAAGLSALFALSTRVPAGRVALFIVPRLSERSPTGGLPIYGTSGGVPIPVVGGGPHSGVAVAAETARTDTRAAGIAIAHELGHALGLFHTTEPSGQGFDSLDSTPRCGADRDSNHDGVVEPSECAGAGADNLMFWALGSDTPTLTGEQAELLRRSPHTVGP
jgi:hypothetical protein